MLKLRSARGLVSVCDADDGVVPRGFEGFGFEGIMYSKENGIFVSRDYSLVTGAEVARVVGPDVRGMRDVFFYPQFYFEMERGRDALKVCVQHEDFERDLYKMSFVFGEQVGGWWYKKYVNSFSDVSDFFEKKEVGSLLSLLHLLYDEIRVF